MIASEQTREGSSLPEPPRTIASRAPRHSPSALRKCALGRGGGIYLRTSYAGYESTASKASLSYVTDVHRLAE